MRKVPLSLLLVLLALLACAAPAQALTLPNILAAPETASEDADEADSGDEDESENEDGSEECEIEDSEDVALCAEIAAEEREEEESERCVVEDATAKLAARPGSRTVELIIHYEAASPVSVAIDARLRGSRGGLHLGSEHTHFRRSGIYRDNFVLGEKQMERALGAREFVVELQAVNTPRYCRLNLEGAPRRAKRPHHAGGRGRSGGRGQTHGR
ncbi:MAG: hypothetical protein E6G51_04170 [Actinobacteria bacterium]|nr:MAG: hypothetical protein E6G51_04170 [Actinomycetota bacterium]